MGKRDAIDKFVDHWEAEGYPVGDICREHRFHPVRRWRFDLAWPSIKIAVEFHGGGFGHQSHGGRVSDYEKLNAALCLGWRVFQMDTQSMVGGEKLKANALMLAEFMCSPTCRESG